MSADLQAVVERLEGCPFCGGRDVDIWSYAKVGSSTVAWAAVCVAKLSAGGECVASGPAMPSEAEAIAAWNTRAPALLAALRQPVEGALDREVVARIIDPGAWEQYDRCADHPAFHQDMVARWVAPSLAKADAFLALQSSNVRDTGRGG